MLVALALGSNLGDRVQNLRSGLEGLQGKGLRLTALSSVYETPAIGYLQQPHFLNMVVLAEAMGSGRDVMDRIRAVEEDLGRERSFRNAPRTVDIDLVFFGPSIVREPGLRVPHPRWKERSFVVRPLRELDPDLLDPETGFGVGEIAELWPLQPEEIRVVEPPGVFDGPWNEGAK